MTQSTVNFDCFKFIWIIFKILIVYHWILGSMSCMWNILPSKYYNIPGKTKNPFGKNECTETYVTCTVNYCNVIYMYIIVNNSDSFR